ncbi:MAG TPA: Hpt domain-containing protein [Xanthobacteraceae bacterium]|jgi:HPt (histidine-containing phosphotransfer) domain-containing protein
MRSRGNNAKAVVAHDAGAIDLVHLRQVTFGDEVLAREVLGLFDAQAERLLATVVSARDERARREAAHTLKGAALGVGARAVADAAADLEAVAGDPERFGGALAHLSALVAVARLAIAGLTARK